MSGKRNGEGGKRRQSRVSTGRCPPASFFVSTQTSGPLPSVGLRSLSPEQKAQVMALALRRPWLCSLKWVGTLTCWLHCRQGMLFRRVCKLKMPWGFGSLGCASVTLGGQELEDQRGWKLASGKGIDEDIPREKTWELENSCPERVVSAAEISV